MKSLLPFVILLGVAACSREPEAAATETRRVTAAVAAPADDSVAAVLQSAGKPAISLRFALEGKPVAGASTQLRLDLAGTPGPLSLQLQGEGMTIEPHSMALTIPEDGREISQSVAVGPQAAGMAEIVAKVQSSADGGQEIVYAIPLLVEAAAAK